MREEGTRKQGVNYITKIHFLIKNQFLVEFLTKKAGEEKYKRFQKIKVEEEKRHVNDRI